MSKVVEFSLRKNSTAHIILMISKFYRRPVNLKDLAIINPIFNTTRQSTYLRIVDRLAKHGFVKKLNNETWTITEEGLQYMYQFAERNARELVE